MSSPEFQATREAHLRSIGREDLIDAPRTKPEPEKTGGLRDPKWVAQGLARMDAEEAS